MFQENAYFFILTRILVQIQVIFPFSISLQSSFPKLNPMNNNSIGACGQVSSLAGFT